MEQGKFELNLPGKQVSLETVREGWKQRDQAHCIKTKVWLEE